MEKIRIVIVDDSPFSIAYIRNILEENGYEVVGDAGTLDEVKSVIKEKRPNLVTMDMTLPGTDGLECTRAVHEIDPSIKVIVISSMMDDEIVKEAKKNRVSSYIQKPVDSDDLVTAITRVMATEELFKILEAEYFGIFKEALLDGVNKMTKTLITFKDDFSTSKEHKSDGMTVIIGIIGKFSGRVLIDLSKETAEKIATALIRRELKSNDEMLGAMSEFTNIFAGNACSVLNKMDKALGLRVAPPSILYGDSVHISAPNFNTTTVVAETNFGEILLNVGFTKGE
jgi:DNA-binding NarL/FixJ family response regulator